MPRRRLFRADNDVITSLKTVHLPTFVLSGLNSLSIAEAFCKKGLNKEKMRVHGEQVQCQASIQKAITRRQLESDKKDVKSCGRFFSQKFLMHIFTSLVAF